ncbi:MAG: hypothetical protein ABSG13_02600 [Bryobacteraceae bacterium]|jgi:hypothetical protein
MKRFLAAAAFLALPLTGIAQTDAKTDLQGIWQAKGAAYLDLEKFVVEPAGGKIPYRADALAKRKENFEKRETADTVKKCFLPGVPRINLLPMPFQIFQSGKFVAIVYQYAHAYRTISLDVSQHLDGIDFWMGDSRGHWEGSTLVVDVADFNDQTWLDAAGDYHSDALHVVERYTRTGPRTITYEATIDDPKVFTHAWTIHVPLELNTEKNARLMEYECDGAGKGTQ